MLTQTRRLKKVVSLAQIESALPLFIEHDDGVKVIDSISEYGVDANESTLQFTSELLSESPSSVTIAPVDSEAKPNILRTPEPKKTFFRIVAWLEKNVGFENIFACEIADSARIHDTASISSAVSIGEGCVIGPGVVIYPNVALGNNCVIEANSVIGNSGFGVIRDPSGNVMIPHIGGVITENDVRIGALCTIDRGTIGLTAVGSFTTIDDKVHIAHNCNVGPRNVICGGVNIGGSVITGSDVWLGLGCSIRQKLKIGNDATVGIGANIFHDVKPQSEMVGYPSKRLPT